MNWWDTFVHYASRLMDKPVVIAVTTILTFLVSALAIVAKTSIGTKALLSLKGLYRTGQEKAALTLQKVEAVEKLATEKIAALAASYEQKAEELKANYEQKAAALISIVNYYEESVFTIIEKIPNAKVQEELKKYKETYLDKKKEITEVVGVIYQDFDANLEKIHDDLKSEYSEKIDFLEKEIKQLTLYFNEIKEVEPNGQERENTDSTKEEIQNN